MCCVKFIFINTVPVIVQRCVFYEVLTMYVCVFKNVIVLDDIVVKVTTIGLFKIRVVDVTDICNIIYVCNVSSIKI